MFKNAKNNNLKLKPYHYENYSKAYPKFILDLGIKRRIRRPC